jgi:hypothetical protein
VRTVSESMEGLEMARNERERENVSGGDDADGRAEEVDAVEGGVSLQPDVKSTIERSLEGGEEPESGESPAMIVGVQCEMGRHRSVAMAEELGRLLGGREGWNVEVLHRDLGSGTKVSKKGVREGKSRKDKWGEERTFMGDGGNGGSWED